MKIGLAGSATQTSHIKEILKEKYDIVDLQSVLERKRTKIGRFIGYLNAAKDVDLIYNVGTYHSIRYSIAKILGKPIITHWIGTDVKNLTEGALRKSELTYVDLHLVCFKQLQDELKNNGIEAEMLPVVPAKVNYDICNMPRTHAVLCYIPTGREDLYGCSEILAMAAKFPDISFYIVDNENKSQFDEYPNISCLGKISFEEMTQLYNKVSILLRPTKHDGLSLMVLEALGKGKQVIWSQTFPYTYPGTDINEVEESLTLLLQSANFEPRANLEAHEYVVKNYSPQAYLKTFDQYVQQILRDCN